MAIRLNDRAKKIADLCKEARDMYEPEEDGTTYCNMAVNHVLVGFKYGKFHRVLANDQVRLMRKNEEWAEVSPEDAKKLADDGRIVVAGKQDSPNGHVAIVLPGRALAVSRKWGNKKVPTVSNVGKRNWICGANYAFKDPPQYWVLIEDA